jgi:peptidoglycan/LPS O-acetylase OafA/YrhL
VVVPRPAPQRWGGRFRPDLEGLRAVAVVLVLLYHAGVPGFGGGYVGVDVFFVLSGFLITGLIHRELSSTGHFSFANFYARRARRLLPAAAFVLLVTLVAAAVILPAYRLPAVQTDIASAGLYVSNMRFGIQANDYFEGAADVSPVLHYWSLSVEEQFYILWPAILVGLAALPGVFMRGRRVAIGILGIGVVSLVAAIWLTGVNQPWAFYLLPTRAWELAVGGLIAVGLGRLNAIPPRLGAGATVVGLVFIVAAALLFNDETPFPGIPAILPVAGAALVILGGLPKDAPLPARLLALGPFRYLGRISYSLYLWHWPILLLGGVLLGPTMAIPLALFAIPVAAASQRWIEEPLRHGRLIGIRPSRNLLQAAGVGLAIVIASTMVSAIPAGPAGPAGPAVAGGGIPARPSAPSGSPGTVDPSQGDVGPQPCAGCTFADLTPPLDDLRAGRIRDGRCEVPDMADCVLGSTSPDAPVVALYGDSHAGNWTAVLSQLASAQGWRFVHLTYGGCPSVPTLVWNRGLKRPYTECDAWRDQALARLDAERPDLIIVANGEHYDLADASGARVYYRDPLPPDWTQLWSSGLDTLLGRLKGISGAVVVIGDGPVPNKSDLQPADCLAKAQADFRTCQAARNRAVRPAVHRLDKSIAAAHGAVFINPTSWLCGADSCPAVIDTYIVYLDGSGHLTTAFTMSLADRLLAALPSPG